jgi:hypothetical protein
LEPVKDYDAYEFRSPINVWNPADEHKSEMDKLRFLDFEVHAGYVLSVPPYWWYSIRFLGEKPSYLSSITYHSLMNLVAHIPEIGLYYLQNQNIQKKYSKADLSEEEEEEDDVDLKLQHVKVDESPKEATLRMTKDLDSE